VRCLNACCTSGQPLHDQGQQRSQILIPVANPRSSAVYYTFPGRSISCVRRPTKVDAGTFLRHPPDDSSRKCCKQTDSVTVAVSSARPERNRAYTLQVQPDKISALKQVMAQPSTSDAAATKSPEHKVISIEPAVYEMLPLPLFGHSAHHVCATHPCRVPAQRGAHWEGLGHPRGRIGWHFRRQLRGGRRRRPRCCAAALTLLAGWLLVRPSQGARPRRQPPGVEEQALS